ncbi:MAG: OFA family MFS transporter [Capnocytophaga sp.]|nr:OFA family MFS transporter [Capnocytophaga sp.]
MSNSWKTAIVGTLIHTVLGTVYAWSYFQTPIMQLTDWNNTQTTMAFSLAIFSLGLTASWAGRRINVYSPQRLTIIGGLLFGIGYLIASYALEMNLLVLFYIGFGLVSGCGLGLAYVTPVAVVSRWFSKHQGLATGMVVMGFGLGAFVMSKLVAPYLFDLTGNNVSVSFRYIGFVFLAIVPLLGFFLKFPENTKVSVASVVAFHPFRDRTFLIFWFVFTLNIIAGMIFLSFQSPLYQELLQRKSAETLDVVTLTSAGATLIAISAVANGIGRLFWAALSDKIGRVAAFRALIGVEILAFIGLLITDNSYLFAALVCLILLGYGGGFGILPSLVKDHFGAERMPQVYGLMLTGWSIGGLVGPQLTALLKDNFGTEAGTYAFLLGLGVTVIALSCLFLKKKPS